MYKYPDELAQYDNDKVKELVMARLENTFIMEDGALYSYTGAEGTSIQIKLSYSSLLGISLGDFTAPEYDYQKFRIDLTQEVLASILQIPYDLKSAASPVFSQDTHSQENDQRGIFDGYITLQSEGTLELPVPDPPPVARPAARPAAVPAPAPAVPAAGAKLKKSWSRVLRAVL